MDSHTDWLEKNQPRQGYQWRHRATNRLQQRQRYPTGWLLSPQLTETAALELQQWVCPHVSEPSSSPWNWKPWTQMTDWRRRLCCWWNRGARKSFGAARERKIGANDAPSTADPHQTKKARRRHNNRPQCSILQKSRHCIWSRSCMSSMTPLCSLSSLTHSHDISTIYPMWHILNAYDIIHWD
jgi:hypothetical protein